MQLSILTPTKKILEGASVDELFAPASVGQLNILPGHANLVSQLETGVLRWRSGSTWTVATVSYGWLEIKDQHITVLADVSEMAREIDVERAKAAEIVARKKLEEGGLNDDNFRKYELKLKRAMARVDATST